MPAWLIPLLLGGANVAAKFFEKGPKEERFSRFTPEQEQLQKQLLSLLGGAGGQEGLLGRLLGQEGFDEFAAPYRREFFESTVPGIAERFSGGFGVPGAASAQRSSGFQQALARSAERLSENLASMRGQQQFGSLGTLLGGGMQPSFTTGYQAGSRGPLADFLSPINQAYGQHLASQLGGLL